MADELTKSRNYSEGKMQESLVDVFHRMDLLLQDDRYLKAALSASERQTLACQMYHVHCCLNRLYCDDAVATTGQCANCHDLGNSTEPEVLGVPDLLHVPEALWCMPVGNTTVSFCTCSRGLSKDWGSRTTAIVASASSLSGSSSDQAQMVS